LDAGGAWSSIVGAVEGCGLTVGVADGIGAVPIVGTEAVADGCALELSASATGVSAIGEPSLTAPEHATLTNEDHRALALAAFDLTL
jgi:hypothetical protein